MRLLPLLVTFEHVPPFLDLCEYSWSWICFCIPNLDGFVNLPSADWVAIWFDFFWFLLFVQPTNLSGLFLEMYPMGIVPFLCYIFDSDILSLIFEKSVQICFLFCCFGQTRFDFVIPLCQRLWMFLLGTTLLGWWMVIRPCLILLTLKSLSLGWGILHLFALSVSCVYMLASLSLSVWISVGLKVGYWWISTELWNWEYLRGIDPMLSKKFGVWLGLVLIYILVIHVGNMSLILIWETLVWFWQWVNLFWKFEDKFLLRGEVCNIP